MLVPRDEPFPFEAVRDLLGILRAMYGAELSARRHADRLSRLERVARELRTAMDLAMEHESGTLGHAAAWRRAEAATREVGLLVDLTTPLEPTLGAAARRVMSSAGPAPKEDPLLKRRRRG